MSSQGGDSVARIGRLRSMLLDYPVAWLAAGVVSMMLGVAGLFGGFEKAPDKPVPSASVNNVYATKAWNITIHATRVVDDLPPLVLKNKGDRWFIVVATVEITAKESLSLFSHGVLVRGVDGLLTKEASEIRYASTAGLVVSLQPNVPERIGYFWEQSADAPIPTNVDVGIWGATYHEPSSGSNVYGWIPDGGFPLAIVKVPVEDRREKK